VERADFTDHPGDPRGAVLRTITGIFSMKAIFLSLLLGLFFSNLQAGELKIVASTSSMGMLARVVGGEQAGVTVLAPPDRDAHSLQARPSMIKDLRGADLLIAVGAELEAGWLPVAIERSTNRRIQPGQPGYFEAAAQVSLIDAGGPADRAQGDVHPLGNPHLMLDPQRMAEVARALALRLAELDPANAEVYRQRAQAFAGEVAARLPGWRAQAEKAPGVVLQHKDADYLMRLLAVPVLGYIEPLAGIPPTAAHLQNLLETLKGRAGVILRASFQAPQGADFLARELDWPSRALPLDPPLEADAGDYLDLIGQWVAALNPSR
jgi:zinc/manganese transport system substrate-binding protein